MTVSPVATAEKKVTDDGKRIRVSRRTGKEI